MATHMPLYEQIVTMLRDQARAGIFPAHIAELPLAPDTRLGDLGIDSLGKMGLLTSLMDLTDSYFPDDAFQDHHTLAEISVIAEASGAGG
jgi:acyl carrier protein